MKEINCIKNIDGGIKGSSWERYKESLMTNEYRIQLYILWDRFDSTGSSSSFRYKTKEQEEWVEWLMEHFKFRRGFLITLHLPSYLTFGRFSETSQRINQKNPSDYFFQIEQILTRFYRRLESRVSKGGKHRLEKFSVIEGCYSKYKRNHIHTLVECPHWMSYEQMEHLIRLSHGSTHLIKGVEDYIRELYGIHDLNKSLKRKMFELGKIHIQRLDTFGTKQRLFTYLTKECRKDTYTVSSKNTYDKRSSRCLGREKSVSYEKRKWIPNSKHRGLLSLLNHMNLTDKEMRDNIRSIKIDNRDNEPPKPSKRYKRKPKRFDGNTLYGTGLNDLGNRNSSSLSRIKRINDSLSRVDSPN
jgi:hypothetical protein